MGGFYNIVLIIYLYVVHVIICNPRNSASGCNVVSILIIIIIIVVESIEAKTIDLPIVVEPIEAKTIDLPIVVEPIEAPTISDLPIAMEQLSY